MAMLKFNWTYKGGVTSAPNGVGRTAYAVIADYIQKNKHKTAEQLRDDLNFEGDLGNNWDSYGTRPFTIQQHVKMELYYYPEQFNLESGEVIRISKQCWGATGTVEDFWNGFKDKMTEHGYIIKEEDVTSRLFYWKRGSYQSQVDGVGRTAYTAIADYIEKNKNKSLEELRDDLDIRVRNHGIGWDNNGLHPFTLRQHITEQDEWRFFLDERDVIHLHDEDICISTQWGATGTHERKWNVLKIKMAELGYTILQESEEAPSEERSTFVSQEVSREVSLLQQFKQIILYGPPGTGKTYRARKEMLPQVLGVTEGEMDGLQGKRWDIVQFHPSYNYEDFVRGVTVKTTGNNVAYKTENRTFGDICKRAEDDLDPNNKYALIIDEINRANVSAVLGELIYALEYRGEKIKTPYTIDGEEDSMLVIPKNLYIIGTMNTADRTIGQIDYAVRRRFAFVHCPPDINVIMAKAGSKAKDAFYLVDKIFRKENMSSDYDADDVRIGHSYFLPKHHENLSHKIVYQVVPILWEYVKDGILLKCAEDEISALKKKFLDDVTISDGLEGKSSNDSSEEEVRGNPFYYWEKEGRLGINGIARTVLSITQDYVNQHPEKTLEEVQEWFPDKGKDAQNRGIKSEVINREDRFFTKEEEVLIIDGKAAYVTSQWVDKKSDASGVVSLEEFIEGVKGSGYAVIRCYVVNIQEIDKKRSWDACEEFGYVSASGVKENGQSRTIGLQKIKKGTIVFALLLTDSDKNKGFIGMGKVKDEAVPINQFKVKGIPILNSLCKDGQKYREKYSVAAEHANDEQKREWMVGVDWLDVLERKNAEGSSTPGHVTFSKVSSSNLKIIKAKFEKDK